MGVQHLRVPYGLIRALCYPGGYRLPPRVSRTRPPEPEGDCITIPYAWSPTSNTVSHVINPTSVTLVGPSERINSLGNLSNEAYKFFRGSAIKSSSYFECRGCGQTEYATERKLTHLKACRLLMQAIEARIRLDKVCVICNTSTTKECWRIPLCSEVCITKWRFQQPECWQVARRFVLSNDPTLLKVKCESIQPNS